MTLIAKELEQYTLDNSNFDTSRDYVSLSHMAKSEDELVRDFFDGYTDTRIIRLKCYKGNQMERNLYNRLRTVFPDSVAEGGKVVHPLYNMIKGHPDFRFDGYPGDCKSVLMDEWIPSDITKVSKKIQWQMQAYMYRVW